MSRRQAGYIFKVKGKNGATWHGRWYQDEIVDGVKQRVQHCEKLVEYGDSYRCKKDVQVLLDEKLAPINSGTASATSTLPIVEFFEKFYLPHAEAELAQSTVHGYKGLWRMYLKPRLGSVRLRDFTCGQAVDVLQQLHREKGLSRKSLRNCKGLLQSVFSYARQTDVLRGENPIQGAAVPRKAMPAGKTHAYTMTEISMMLSKLTGTAHTAVALMFFCGLRPGEAIGVKWADYDEAKRLIRIQRSIWRKHEKGPKTQDSVAPVHVPEVLAEILDGPCVTCSKAKSEHETDHEFKRADRSSDYILATPSGKPVDLHNLAARQIVPALTRCLLCGVMEGKKHAKAAHPFELDQALRNLWQGFYANRRGIATAIQDVDNALAAKSHLRHSNVSTTTAHYIKSVDAAAVRAVDKINELFDNAKGSGRPN